MMYQYGGYNAKTQPLNFEPYLYVPALQEDKISDWIMLFKRLNIKLANCFLWFINGSYYPRFEGIKEAVAAFKENGIACQLHCYSDLIEKSVVGLDIQRDSNGAPLEFFGMFVPTTEARRQVADNLAKAYVNYGFDGGIYFDAIDYHAQTRTQDEGIVFQYRVIDQIPGGCPVDTACKWERAWPLLSRWGSIDTPRDPKIMKEFVDAHSKVVAQAGYLAPFFGWLNIDIGWNVNDIYYYLSACNRLGASYCIDHLTPANADQYKPLVDAIAFYNSLTRETDRITKQ